MTLQYDGFLRGNYVQLFEYTEDSGESYDGSYLTMSDDCSLRLAPNSQRPEGRTGASRANSHPQSSLNYCEPVYQYHGKSNCPPRFRNPELASE